MTCNNCGKTVDDNSVYCNHCGAKLSVIRKIDETSDDNSSFGFAILGFIIPLAGLIMFLIYDGKSPRRAKSSIKGALAGFITRIVLRIIVAVVYFLFAASLVTDVMDYVESDMSIGDEVSQEEDYTDVSFGEFKMSNNGYYTETALDVTVKNLSDKQYTYCITVEAVDATGARIDTDTIYAYKLRAGQEIRLTAFNYVSQDKINQFKNATFDVLEINKYDY